LRWFELIESNLSEYEIDVVIIKKYYELFDELLKISVSTARIKSYKNNIVSIITKFKEEIIIVIMKSSQQLKQFNQIEQILENVDDKERVYLTEAIGCANYGFFRAAVVLGWSAAVHRMHKIVQKRGFNEFSKQSKELKKISEGRYKRFTASVTIHNLSEFQTNVFDKNLLWVLEYWGLIDSNQHDRLSICFTMRNNAGHPGEASISPENLLSFYSDIKNYVFDNENFKL